MLFNIILAIDSNQGIGINNQLPWKFKEDMKYFKSITTKTELPNTTNAVIMGRKTFESCGILKNRLNLVITRNPDFKNEENLIYCSSFNHALGIVKSKNNVSKVWVIGGAQIYNQAFRHHLLNKIYLTRIMGNFSTDVKLDLPDLDIIKSSIQTCFNENNNQEYEVTFSINKIKDKSENQYMRLLKDINENGIEKETRNGITKSLIGKCIKFDLDNGFPLLTTKKMFWRGIVEELLFFIRGDTNTKLLEEKKINIWKGNTNKQFLEDNALNYKEGEMGPMYGYQWRSFNGKYPKKNGLDQFKKLIWKIKNNPNSRRLLMTDYNPLQAEKGVLYPCHSLILQFFVTDNKLHVSMYQRSADVFLGLPFNIASTSLLLCIMSKLTDYQPGTVTLNIGDCHIYKEHYQAVETQLSRTSYKLPDLEIPDFKSLEEVEKSDYKDYQINNYQCHKRIKAKMVA